MANLPPNHNEFAPAAEAAPDNMNGWGADPLYPPPPASDSESEIEFEEAEAETEAEAEVAPIPPHVPANPEAAIVGTGRLTPLKRLFTDTQVWTGLSSSSAAIGHNPKDPTPSHIRSDLDARHRKVRHIKEDDYQEPPYALPEALLAPVTHNDPRDPIMAPKAMSQAAIERLITERVNVVVEVERERQVNARG
ncbi:hypothetical protein Tco_1376955 [Tanacetum coccineum]